MGFLKPKQIETPRDDDELTKPNIWGVRHVQALLMFFGLIFGYFLRVNMSAAIVPMTQATPRANWEKQYDWDSSTKSLILSSFFWGYVVAQVPAGLLAKRFGAKIVLSVATIIAATLTILHPFAAYYGGWQFIVALRVFIGLTQGVVYPCVHTFLSKWAPCTERSVIATCIYSGAQLGTVIILATSGEIFDSSIGWPGIFYLSGGITLAWAIALLIFGEESPANSRYISKAELEYIKKHTGSADTGTANAVVPWKAFFTSMPFYALIMAHSGYTWGFYTLLTEMPSYMNKVLKLDVKSNALLSALPYFVMWLLSLAVCPISDLLINRKILSVTTSRKIFNSISQWIPMVSLIGLAYMTEDNKTLAITLLTIGVGFNAASYCGYMVNHMDLSPNFAGPMMGITNGFSNLCSIFAPLVVGVVVKNESDPVEWRIVFFITAGVYLFCNLFFVIFGSGRVQPFNDLKTTTATTEVPYVTREHQTPPPDYTSTTTLDTNADELKDNKNKYQV